MAGGHDKRAAKAKAAALQRYGGASAAVAAVYAVRHWAAGSAFTWAQCLGLAFVALLAAACVYLLAEAAEAGVDSEYPLDVWAVCAVATLVACLTPWGWYAFAIIPVFAAWKLWAAVGPVLQQLLAARAAGAGPAEAVAAALDGPAVAGPTEAEEKRRAKKERQAKMEAARAKGKSPRGGQQTPPTKK